MKIVFMGTPDFAVPSLDALVEAGHEVCMVLTQPDKQVGRGGKVQFSPVKARALELGLRVLQPSNLKKEPEYIAALRMSGAELFVVAAFGQILSQEVLDIAPRGCINVHGSLLPKYRGAAPIQHAILAGETETGVTIMDVAEALDAGDMLSKVSTPTAGKTADELHDELAVKGAKLLVDTIKAMVEGTVMKVPQKDSESTYAPMISKADGEIDYLKSAEEIERLVRAMNSWPVAHTTIAGKVMKVWKAEIPETVKMSAPGTVIEVTPLGIDVATAKGIIRFTEIQMPNKKRMPVSEFIKGNTIEPGTVLGKLGELE